MTQQIRADGADTSPEAFTADHKRDLIDHLVLQTKAHPVLIFGTGQTGKTVLLLSLLHYAQQSLSMDLLPAPHFFFPPSFPLAARREELGEKLLRNDLEQYGRGCAPARTDAEVPFFLTVRISHGGESRDFAFIETRGEWFERGADERFKPLREEIDILLSYYPNPLSLIFVAPNEISKRHDHLRAGHESMRNAMQNYSALRKYAGKDDLLYLLSQWDISHGAEINPAQRLREAPPGQIATTLMQAPLSTSWAAFSPNEALAPARSKSLLPYSAGLFQDNIRAHPDLAMAPVFDRYPQSLWNWLWGNVTQGDGGVRRCIFPDSVPRPIPTSSLGDRVMAGVTAVGRRWWG